MPTLSKQAAQRRVDQIAAFREEAAALEREGVALGAEDLARARAHQDLLLAQFAREFDVDRSARERQMSAGMLLASVFGAAAMTAAVVSFVYRVWGTMPTAAQVTLVTLAPIAALLVAAVAAALERTRYVASLFATVACAAFALQLYVLGSVFNLRSSPHVLGLTGAFALMVALPWRLMLPFAVGAVALSVYAPALAMWATGVSWTNVVSRPEFIAASMTIAVRVVSRGSDDLTRAARLLLMVLALGMLFLMTVRVMPSVLPASEETVAIVYQVLAAVVTVALLVAGIRSGSEEVTLLGTLFGAAFLLSRFVDWWWDWMPRYLFFLIVGAVAVLALLALMRLRAAAGPRPAGEAA